MDKASVQFLKFPKKGINYIFQLFSDNGSIKKWNEFKGEYNLHEIYYQWLQLIDSIPKRWKLIIKKTCENATNLIIHDYQLMTGLRVIT